jgi:subtilisin family serine protease
MEEYNARCLEGKISGQFIVKMSDGSHHVVAASSREDLVEKLQSAEQIEIFEKQNIRVSAIDYNFRVEVKQNSTTALAPPRANTSTGPEMLNAPFLWDKGFKGKGVVTALIDSGYDINHPFLADSVLINSLDKGNDEDGNGFKNDTTGWDFINNKPLTRDLGKHGTYVGSVIAAKHNIYVRSSMAPESKILPIAALDTGEDQETDASGDNNTIIKSLDYAMSKNVDIINASWAGYICSKFIRTKIKEANDNGIFVVTSAGNEKTNLDEKPIFPGSLPYPLVVTVGAVNSDLSIETDSNFGSAVDFFAFGQGVTAAAPQTQGLNDNPSGTSLSAPFISGALALLKNAFPNRSPEALLDALEGSKSKLKIPDLESAFKDLKSQ